MIFKDLVNSIFFSVIQQYGFKTYDSSGDVDGTHNKMVLRNDYCFLSISHHMGESNVYFSTEEFGSQIHPLMWSLILGKINYKDIIPLKFSPDTKMQKILGYTLAKESTYISLFCRDLLEGNFEDLDLYFEKLTEMNEKLYEHYSSLESK